MNQIHQDYWERTAYENGMAVQQSYEDGQQDARNGIAPQYLDDAYVSGYLTGIRELGADAFGRIQYACAVPMPAPNWIEEW